MIPKLFDIINSKGHKIINGLENPGLKIQKFKKKIQNSKLKFLQELYSNVQPKTKTTYTCLQWILKAIQSSQNFSRLHKVQLRKV